MRLVIVAAGRLRSGPELDLFDDYRNRFERTGRALGL
ncbi:MAG: 23S rRNA (pseudouridine(1915)-N(3))-methyltransferase RlmH, partial [Pseudomonadota bacterium]